MFNRKPKSTPVLFLDDATRDRLSAALRDAASTHICLTVTVDSRGDRDVATHLPDERVAVILRDAADQYAAQSGTFRASPEAERLSAILRLAAGRPGYATVTVKELLSAGIVDDEPATGGES